MYALRDDLQKRLAETHDAGTYKSELMITTPQGAHVEVEGRGELQNCARTTTSDWRAILRCNLRDAAASYFPRKNSGHGLFVGPSAGAHYLAAGELRSQRPDLTHVVSIFPDEGEKYISDYFL